MIALQKAKGIILLRKIINGKDVIIEVLTENQNQIYRLQKFWIFGILKSKKRNPITVEPGNLISLDYYEKSNQEIHHVKEFDLIERFSEIKKTYENLELLSKILKISYYAAHSDSNLKELYVLLIHAFQYIENYLTNPDDSILNSLQNIQIYFQDSIMIFILLRIFNIMGLVGEMNICSSCKGSFSDEKAKWQDAIYFYCEKCDSTANSIDYFYMQIIQSSLQNKYKYFIINLDKSITKNFDDITKNHILNEFFKKIENYTKSIFPINDKLFY